MIFRAQWLKPLSNWSKYNAKPSFNTKWRQISIECLFEQRFQRIHQSSHFFCSTLYLVQTWLLPYQFPFQRISKKSFLYRCFLILTIGNHIGNHVGNHIQNSFSICIKFVKRRPKDVWKMSLGDVRIMMFYGCSDNVNLVHSIRCITITFITISIV